MSTYYQQDIEKYGVFYTMDDGSGYFDNGNDNTPWSQARIRPPIGQGGMTIEKLLPKRLHELFELYATWVKQTKHEFAELALHRYGSVEILDGTSEEDHGPIIYRWPSAGDAESALKYFLGK